MLLVQIAVGPMKNFSYLVSDEVSGSAAVFDPGFDADTILSEAMNRGLRIEYVFNTHSHSDHCSGNDDVRRSTNAKIVAHVSAPIYKDVPVVDGSKIVIGKLEAVIIHTPGHSKDSMCVLIEDKLITGDTLFVGECGRTDLKGGNSGDMYESLFKKILSLPDNVEIYPGHDYGQSPHSTIGFERGNNYTLKPMTREEFIVFMSEP